MTISICIAIGAENYGDKSIETLPGAAIDARAFYEAATDTEYGTYEKNHSKHLADPTKEDVREAVANAVSNPNVKNLTLYFAGHGVETSSGYFLTCRDTVVSRMALTGLSLTDVFQLLNERVGLHTNIILDACEAGGVAIDLPAITKSFEVGVAGGSSVSILTMSSRREAAEEASDGSGGLGTKALLRVMRGDIDTGKNIAVLTLADIAQVIDVTGSAQTPSFWSFNLQGASVFCKNVYALKYRRSEVYETPEIFGAVQIELTKEHREWLWKCYLDFQESPCARSVYEVISKIISDEKYGDATPSILSGVFESFLHRSRASSDAFAPVLLIAVFSMLASEKMQNLPLTEYFIKVLSEELENILYELADNLEADHLFLVQGAGGYSEFFSLPQRITSLVAWSLMATRLPTLFGNNSENISGITRRIMVALSHDYMGSFHLISETQASAMAVISALGTRFDEDWTEQFMGCLYNSYFSHNGKIARVDLPAGKVFTFLKHRISDEKADFQDFCDRPSEALFVLFVAFWHLARLDTVRYDLAELDGTVLGTFIPQKYSTFSENVVRDGINIHIKIGFEVFTITDLSTFFEQELMPRIAAASKDVSSVEKVIATCAALIFPDRVPWHLLDGKSQ